MATKQAGFDFTLVEVEEWLEKQLLYLIHKARSKVKDPLQCNKVGSITYIFCLTCIDVASRYKWAEPIRTTLDIINMDKPFLEDILIFNIVAKVFIKIFNNPKCLLTWPKVLLTDIKLEFKGSCKKLIIKHSVKIQKASSKSSMDAHELLLSLYRRSRAWVKNLPIIIKELNNSITHLLGITSNKAIKKKFVYTKASKPRYGPIGYNEVHLIYNNPVLYLLKPDELEGRRRCSTDYINENGPKQSFVQEELQIIHPNTELPLQWVLTS
ncbi:2013_t:CDS:2 [Cetraspora pellucida]|uniref:2013_t:CDS:1 n=1 Tax=Cetraspora pellucida TaxID=1433469 RepID=A0A9N8VZF6_9GLOM|nr:2013_t:CDS:2 [Cetraspora pellucida]